MLDIPCSTFYYPKLNDQLPHSILNLNVSALDKQGSYCPPQGNSAPQAAVMDWVDELKSEQFIFTIDENLESVDCLTSMPPFVQKEKEITKTGEFDAVETKFD